MGYLLLGLCVLYGLSVGSFSLAYSFLASRISAPGALLVPILWVSIEFLRSELFWLIPPWALLGHSQYTNIPLIQMAAITGVYGISFLIAMVNGVIFDLCLSRRVFSKLVWVPMAAVVLCYVLGSGLLWLASPKHNDIRVAVIQPNIPQETKWDSAHRQHYFFKHLELSQAVLDSGTPTVTIWPETSIPDSIFQNREMLGNVLRFAKEAQQFLIIGTASRPKFGSREQRTTRWHNTALVVRPSGRIGGRYSKMTLVPFGEYVPFEESVPWPSALTESTGHFIPGDTRTLFDIQNSSVGVLICWETLFPNMVRQFVSEGADLLVNISNEAPGGRTSASYQFLSMNVFRAVENRRSLVRSTNSGISGVIDPYGRIVSRVEQDGEDIFVDGFLQGQVQIEAAQTFYSHYGDIFSWVVVFAAGGVFLTGLRLHSTTVSPVGLKL